MSEKRTPVSIYLTPRAAMILRDYNQGSGYGSISRTVEEIILAFDAVYKDMKSLQAQMNQMVPPNPRKQQEQAAIALISIIAMLKSISNTISRLQRASDSSASA